MDRAEFEWQQRVEQALSYLVECEAKRQAAKEKKIVDGAGKP